MIAWLPLRRALMQLRAETRLNIRAFSRESGINHVTIRRVEALKKEPGYEPTLGVIQAWLGVTSGQPVWAFLRKYEGNPDDPSRQKIAEARVLLETILKEIG